MYICPKCERPLRNPNAWHDCVKTDIDTLFQGKNEELVLVFDKVLAELIDWEGVEVSTTSNCIVFVRNKTFLIIRPMKKEIDLKFYLEEKYDEFPISKTAPYNSKWEHHIRLSCLEDLNVEVIRFLRKSYEMC